jgi:hypothetical protein
VVSGYDRRKARQILAARKLEEATAAMIAATARRLDEGTHAEGYIDGGSHGAPDGDPGGR